MLHERRQWRRQMSKTEQTRGWVFLVIFVAALPFLMGGIRWAAVEGWDDMLSDSVSSAAYYYVAAAAVVLLFWHYLRGAFDTLLEWMPENLFGFLTGLGGFFLLRLVTERIPLLVDNPVWQDDAAEYQIAPGVTVVIVVILMPLVEEVLFRGVMFGSLRKINPVLAWGITILASMLYPVWQYAVTAGDWRYLLLCVRFLPQAAAYTWCFSRGGSVWSSVFLHMLCSGILLSLAVGA